MDQNEKRQKLDGDSGHTEIISEKCEAGKASYIADC